MSETTSVPPSTHTGLKDRGSTISSCTRERFASVNLRSPGINAPRPVYVGIGYSSASTPYRRGGKASTSKFSTTSRKSKSKSKRVSDELKEPINKLYNPSSDPPLLHKSILQEHSQRKEPTATYLHILDILHKAREGNKKTNSDILNPYIRKSSFPIFSSRKPEENEKFLRDITKQAEPVKKPSEKKSSKKRARDETLQDICELTALDMAKTKCPRSS